MIKILTLMKNIMDEMNLPYTFDKWDADLVLPHWIGEISEVKNTNEDGKNEYSFLLTGFDNNYTCLFNVANDFKKRFATGSIIDGVAIMYDNTLTVPTGDDNLKQVQINFTIKDWGVE